MKPLLLGGALLLAGVGTAGAVYLAVPGGEEEIARQVETGTPEPVWGTGAAPQYDEPVLLVPGNYVSPVSLPGADERGLAAAEAESLRPRFEGELNGFRVFNYDPLTEDGSEVKIWCSGGKIVEFRLDSRLTFEYLPPGTSALSPQSASVCEDGSVQQVQQGFITSNATFDIYYQAGERAFDAYTSADRLAPATITGRSAVVMRPLTEEGFGEARIAMATERGFIAVHASRLPLTEVMKIAEGVKCTDC